MIAIDEEIDKFVRFGLVHTLTSPLTIYALDPCAIIPHFIIKVTNDDFIWS